MELYCYCLMPSHACPEQGRRVHFIFRSAFEDPSGLLRDFKTFTSKKVLVAIQQNEQESRREWLLWMFERAGKKNATTSKYQFWQQHNKPIELWSNSVIKQKVSYIHRNPVEAGFVINEEDWKYSSAKNFADDYGVLEIDDMGFLG